MQNLSGKVFRWQEKIVFHWRENDQEAYVQDSDRLPKDGSDIEPETIKELLSIAGSKYAYWMTVAAMLGRKIGNLKIVYDIWYAEKYHDVDDANPRRSEGSKKNVIFFDCPKIVKSYFVCLNGLQELYDKVVAVAKGYEIISRTHQSILGFMRSELSMIPGGGNLNEV